MNLFKSRVRTGLDLGARNIKLVKIGGTKKKVHLEKIILHDLSQNNIEYPNEKGTDFKLRGIVETHRIAGDRVSLHLNPQEHTSFNIDIPKMPDKEMRKVILNEAADRSNLDPSQLSADYTFIPTEEPKKASTNTQKVKVFSSPIETIKEKILTISEARLAPWHIQPNLTAIVSMLSFNDYLVPDKNQVLIDMGENQISIALIRNGCIIENGALHIGSGAINHTLFNKLEMSYEDAEKIKNKYSLKSETDIPEYIQSLVDDFYYEVIYKVQRLKDYYGTLSSEPIANILLSGGGSLVSDFSEILSDSCALPVERVNPFRNIDIYRKGIPDIELHVKNDSIFSVAVGLALRGLE